jgi:concanavalin A-like lectin/glucanase superfamily protein
VSAYSSLILGTSGLVSYWRLDETSGTTANDSFGSNNGTYTGTFTLGQPGPLSGYSNSATKFNGTNAYVNVPYAAALNTANWTAETWVQLASLPAGDYFLMSSRNGSAGWLLYASSTAWNVESWTGPVNVTGGVATVGAWTHVAATYDGTTLRLYANGVLAGSHSLSYTAQSADAVLIGAGGNPSIPGGFTPGVFAHAAVYNTALSAPTVASHYAVGALTPATFTPRRAALGV